MPPAAAKRVTAAKAGAVAQPHCRRIYSAIALGLGGVTAVAAVAGTATMTAAFMVALCFARDPDLRSAAPAVHDMARRRKPHLSRAADRSGAQATAAPVYAPAPTRAAELTPFGDAAPAFTPAAPPVPAPRRPQRRTAALADTIPLPRPRPAAPSPVTHDTTPPALHVARDFAVLPTPRPGDNASGRRQRTAAASTMALIIAALRSTAARQPSRQHETDRLSPPAATPPPPDRRGGLHRDWQLAADSSGLPSPPGPPLPRQRPAAPESPQSRPAEMAPEHARLGAPRAAPAPTMAALIAAGAAQLPQQHDVDRPAAPPTTARQHARTAPASDTAGAARQSRDPQLAYNNPDVPSAPDSHTAIYDIVTHTVYLPNGERLEAHSGLGRLLDDPHYIFAKGRGATPPNVYDLSLRHGLFHGVQAIRLSPVGDARMYGRAGILAHTYMLGPSGQSFGCVSFKNYGEFLHAFLRGEIDKLVVVPQLRTAPWAERARREAARHYALNTP